MPIFELVVPRLAGTSLVQPEGLFAARIDFMVVLDLPEERR